MAKTPKSELQALAKRAKERRIRIGKKTDHIAERLSIIPTMLNNWERQLPQKAKYTVERIWEEELLVPCGWLRNTSIQVNEASDAAIIDSHIIDLTHLNLPTVAAEIRAIGSWLAAPSAWNRTINIDSLSESDARNAAMFAERYGVLGESSLQFVGDQHNVTRERVRQIVERMSAGISGAKFITPRLQELKSFVTENSPAPLEELTVKCQDLLGECLSLEDADRFARQILGIALAELSDKTYCDSGNSIKRMVYHPSLMDSGLAYAVRDSARRMVRSCGAAQLMYVTGMVSESLEKAVSIYDVKASLQSIEGMEWISEEDGWFWLGMDTVGNRAVEVATKVLAVAGKRVDVEDIQHAICRSRRVMYEKDRNLPPMVELPRSVLRELLAKVPSFSIVQYDDFILKESISPEDVLSPSELAFYQLLDGNGGINSRYVLHNALITERNCMSLVNFQLVIATSPIINASESGILSLRGRDIQLKNIEAAIASSPKHPATAAPLTEEGFIEYTFEITQHHITNRQIDMPSAIMQFVQPGAYSFEGLVSGLFQLGIPSCPNRLSSSFATALRNSVAVGDSVKFKFHPETAKAIVTMESSRDTTTIG